jgi:hypothetical protein
VSDTVAEIERMPYGKHKGEKLADIPFEYLNWAVNPGGIDPERSPRVYAALKAEYDRRWRFV